MILQWDKVIKLHLESFLSNNLIHFWPEWRKICWNSTRLKQNGVYNFLLCSAPRSSRGVSPMPLVIISHNMFIIQGTGLTRKYWTRFKWFFCKSVNDEEKVFGLDARTLEKVKTKKCPFSDGSSHLKKFFKYSTKKMTTSFCSFTAAINENL
jgi:hypothetical protein